MDNTSDSGGMSAIVAIIAIVVILAVGYFIIQMLPANNASGTNINVDLPTGGTGDGQ